MKIYSNAQRISTTIDGQEIHFEKGTTEVSAKQAAVLLGLNSPGNDLFSLKAYRTTEEPKAEEKIEEKPEDKPEIADARGVEEKEEEPQAPTRKTAAAKKSSKKKTSRSRR